VIALSYNRIRDPYGNPMGSPPSPFRFIWSDGTSGADTFRVSHASSNYNVYVNDDATPAFVGMPGTNKIALAGGEGDDGPPPDCRWRSTSPTCPSRTARPSRSPLAATTRW